MKPHGQIVRSILTVGIPSVVMNGIGSVMNFGMNQILQGFTETATGVFGVYFKLQSFFFMPLFGLNNGITPIIAYNYGAAQIDGCTKTQATLNVTIPLMRSSFVQCLFLTITRCFMVYDVNLSLTKGEPFNSSVMAAMHVYNQAFSYKNYGTGQAEALVLFVVCAIVGVTQVYIGKKGEVAA